MAAESRARMVRSAAALIRTRGATATSFSEVLADSGAPRGSIYHHFPNGKQQLEADAIRWTSDRVLARQRECPATTGVGVLECFIDMWRQTVLASNGAAGCVVAGVAIDTDAGEPGMIDIVRETFRSWTALLTKQLEEVGVPQGRAQPIALASVAGMEGALILCRAEGGPGPLETVATELLRLVQLEAPQA
jgi:TetR/AcrR family transcriptional repressor of lmrAB and yxaGH operons